MLAIIIIIFSKHLSFFSHLLKVLVIKVLFMFMFDLTALYLGRM